jgi:hypothetical protein
MTKEALEGLKALSGQHGISAKDVLDYNCQKILDSMDEPEFQQCLSSEEKSAERRVRKSFVLTKGALQILERKSKQHKISRDILLQASIIHMNRLVVAERAKTRDKHENVFDDVQQLSKTAVKIEAEVRERLGSDDDPVALRLQKAVNKLQSLVVDLEKELEQGTPIDPED